MADFARDDAVLVGDVFTLIGTTEDDTITIDSSFSTPGSTSGLLDGNGGNDALYLINADLPTGTVIQGIEQTFLESGFESNLEAANLDDLGTIGMQTTGIAALRLTDVDGVSVAAELALTDGQRISFINGGDNTTSLALDFSGGSFSGDSGIDYAGSSGSDTVIGGTGADVIDGGLGNDILSGGAGDDHLFSGGGTDQLRGGSGNDQLFIDNALTNGLVNGGADNDVININRTMTGGTLNGGGGIDTLELNNSNLVGVSVSGIEQTILQGGFESEVDAANLNDLGQISMEQSTGRLQANNVDGISAAPTVLVEDGQRLAFDAIGGIGTTVTLDFSRGTFLGDSGITYRGTIGSDLVTFGSGDDIIDTGRGDDRIVAGGGVDEITGGLGADTFAFTAENSLNFVTDFTFGQDQIEIFGAPAGFDIYDLARFASQEGDNAVLNSYGTRIEIVDTNLSDFGLADVIFT